MGCACASLCGTAVFAEEPASKPEAAEFFEKQVRPLLATHCYSCHGAKKQEAGLRLDSRAAAFKGSESGPVLLAGKPEESRLVRAIRYNDKNLQMPPDGKLPDEAIAALTRWVEIGLPWPEAPSDSAASDSNAWRKHWAFQPVRQPPLPAIQNTGWVQKPIDHFVLARLEQAGLVPSPATDRRALIRRLSFDLTGLPPAAEEVEAFFADTSSDAVGRLIDRLLDSPHYGERWGRHWLDVARYADSKGYKFFGTNQSYGYTYRDWVIKAFNDDLPYDQFLLRQLAADQLPLGSDNRDLAAMGFLTIGRRFLEDVHDIIDDRIDVVSRGFLGLTVGCARCHDHKFDPVPTADYYSLYGVFAASVERTRTLRTLGQQTAADWVYDQEMATRQSDYDQYLKRRHAEFLTAFRANIPDYLLAGHKALAQPPMDKFMFVEVPGQLSQIVIERWRSLLDRTQKRHDRVFAAWHAFAALPEAEFAAQAAAVAAGIAAKTDPDHPHHPRVASLFATPPANLAEVARRYGELFVAVEQQWQQELAKAAAAGQPSPGGFNDVESEELRRVLYGPFAPPDVSASDVEFLVGRPGQAEIGVLRGKIEEWDRQAPAGFQRAMVLEESPELARFDPHVFVRGRSNNLGEATPRRFLMALSGEDRPPFTQGGGRLELAQAIVGRDNPLTARVLVNRVWLHHFGAGLVTTPSDFGLRSEPPSHSELLDWLAWQFMEQGWSIKQLHRQILLSATYQQASDDRPDARRIDPDNRLLSRMNRRRLDFEATRDALVAASGQLDRTVGGFAVSLTAQPFSHRRTVYGFIDRQDLPGLFRSFDFANPDAHSPQRFTTTVPQQALFLMNSPFVQECAARLAGRPEVAQQTDPAARIEQIYRLLYGRQPTAEETALGLEFLAGKSIGTAAGRDTAPASPWRYGYGSIDSAAGKVTRFEPFMHFTGQRWQGGAALPDPVIGWAFLDAQGGHPGDAQHLAIRRWIAPVDGAVSISGVLKHAETNSDGIQARIVFSRAGEVGGWKVYNQQVDATVARLEVKAGDTVDFVVESLATLTNDQHTWAPIVRLLSDSPDSAADHPRREWNASADFAGQGLNPWEYYAQALLMSNEMVFVD